MTPEPLPVPEPTLVTAEPSLAPESTSVAPESSVTLESAPIPAPVIVDDSAVVTPVVPGVVLPDDSAVVTPVVPGVVLPDDSAVVTPVDPGAGIVVDPGAIVVGATGQRPADKVAGPRRAAGPAEPARAAGTGRPSHGQPAHGRPARRRRRLSKAATWGIVLGCVALVIGLVVGGYFGYLAPYRQARTGYDAALANLTTAQGQLVAQISRTNKLVTTVTATLTPDADTIAALNDRVVDATALTTKPPPRPVTTAGVRSETDRLTGQLAAVEAATARLAGLTDSLAGWAVGESADQLTQALPPAQDVLDQSDGLVADESVRTALQSAIAQASSLLASPPDDVNQRLAEVSASLAGLTEASQAVTQAVKSTAEAAYSYLLTGDAITQGGNLVGGTIASVEVNVQQAAVIVSVCWSNQTVTDPANCLIGNSTTPRWWVWSGMRDGDSAKVMAQSNNPDDFFWGSVSFASSAAQAPAVSFVGASGCARFDGSAGRAGPGGQCA